MRTVFFTIDLEDPINDESIHACSGLLRLFHELEITPLIFLTGDIVKKLASRREEFREMIDQMRIDAVLGYHTNAHVRPVAYHITDVADWSEAKRNAADRECLTPEKRSIAPIKLLHGLFGVEPVACRFPGFSWTPTYIEVLQSAGISHSFDFYPDGLSHLPNGFRRKGMTFIKPDYIVWVDELVRRGDGADEMKKNIDGFLAQFKCLNFSIHPDRLCNRGWWMDHVDAPATPPRFSPKTVDEHLARLEMVLLYIIRHRPQRIMFQDGMNNELDIEEWSFSHADVDTIFNNASVWPKRRFTYEPTYLRQQFARYFLE